jgi:hypothetical protein
MKHQREVLIEELYVNGFVNVGKQYLFQKSQYRPEIQSLVGA